LPNCNAHPELRRIARVRSSVHIFAINAVAKKSAPRTFWLED
jgi:hypothetical protein